MTVFVFQSDIVEQTRSKIHKESSILQNQVAPQKISYTSEDDYILISLLKKEILGLAQVIEL